MTKTRVLMLGPGEPSILNSGLGKAAFHLADSISKNVELTVVQPEKLEEFNESVQQREFEPQHRTEEFTDYQVLSDIAKFEITNIIAPYWYLGGTEKVTHEYTESVVRIKAETYTKEIIEIVDEIEYDVIYAHDWLTFQAAIELKEKTKLPLVLHVHSLDHDRNPNMDRSWVFELEQKAFCIADKIICVSNYSKSIIRSVYGIDGGKINVIYNGFTNRQYKDHQSPFKEKVILFVGRLTNQKGPTEFLKIAEHVHKHYPNSRFIMAGDGELYQSLIEAGAHSRIAHKFHMTGHLSDDELNKLYAMADIYCMPSVSEPFGLSALEAAGAGLPMVISNNSGASEILEGAISLDYNDTLGFANEIVKLLKNEKMKHYYSTKNQKVVHSMTWKEAADQITNIFETV
ncbi:glycosyltransferase family 4 protein [Reichenbachiella versicolor]|uniref:glycosyltransferase family 4 protein n=1 Tax=Reichenbachiella versicolor TaxID=1821036 RepID=UPI000D6DD93B|nr:glycosyltransferase family 4 protein [Reichenbachiella versicolor]